MARATALIVGALAIVLSIALRGYNVAFLVGLAFAVAASANVPVILLALSWRRFSRFGAIARHARRARLVAGAHRDQPGR